METYLGYSVLDFKNHFEMLFDKNMSWENHGTYWHIDHIMPDICHQYSSREDDGFKKSFALANLRPLPKAENHARPKGTKHEQNIQRL